MHAAMQVLQISGSPGMRLRGSEKELCWTQKDEIQNVRMDSAQTSRQQSGKLLKGWMHNS